ncbi:Flagellar hook-associated protein FliD [Photobacterium marinum]|uniref:Flagellar hook-associated protein 2 n=1 Tax=Photobacterium marinum TaxID=1056511 RepID=L8JHT5_9GAMM|nr:flagellar filament capping protein FliD [Photobacterium marinum]ELR67084.1 Flagellar hook-associated protein FliD [Photobacterium marinum]
MLMTGLGSGIDYEAMIGAIIAAERAPKDNQLNRQEGMNNAEMEALKEIQSAVNSFRDKVESLNSSRELQKLKASLSNKDVLSATVDDAAIAGEYGFEVTQMAQAEREQLFKVTEGSMFTAGTISFGAVNLDITTVKSDLVAQNTTKMTDHDAQVRQKIADQYSLDVTADAAEIDTILNDSGDSRFEQARLDSYNSVQQQYQDEIDRLNDPAQGVKLEEIQSAINNHPDNDGVKATLVRSGDGISMVLNGKDTGIANAIGAISVGGLATNGNSLDLALPENGQKNLQVAQDAIVKYGSMELTSATNKMENVIDGITLNLKNTGTVNVKVERDEAAVKDNIKGFVEAYNSVMETVNTYTKSSEDGAAALSGDSATRSMVSRLRGVVGDEFTTSTYQTLSQLGVKTTRQGTLEIDQSKLDKALEDDFDAVSKLFLGDGVSTGMMDSMMTVLDDYHKNGGTFDRRLDQLEYNNERLTKEREQLDERMEAKTLTLRAYYAKMDTKISSMNQTQQMLIGMLG